MSDGGTTVEPLRVWRSRRLLTIRELAELAGVSTRTLQDAEGGAHAIRLATIRKLTQALNVDPAQVAEFRPYLNLD